MLLRVPYSYTVHRFHYHQRHYKSHPTCSQWRGKRARLLFKKLRDSKTRKLKLDKEMAAEAERRRKMREDMRKWDDEDKPTPLNYKKPAPTETPPETDDDDGDEEGNNDDDDGDADDVPASTGSGAESDDDGEGGAGVEGTRDEGSGGGAAPGWNAWDRCLDPVYSGLWETQLRPKDRRGGLVPVKARFTVWEHPEPYCLKIRCEVNRRSGSKLGGTGALAAPGAQPSPPVWLSSSAAAVGANHAGKAPPPPPASSSAPLVAEGYVVASALEELLEPVCQAAAVLAVTGGRFGQDLGRGIGGGGGGSGSGSGSGSDLDSSAALWGVTNGGSARTALSSVCNESIVALTDAAHALQAWAVEGRPCLRQEVLQWLLHRLIMDEEGAEGGLFPGLKATPRLIFIGVSPRELEGLAPQAVLDTINQAVPGGGSGGGGRGGGVGNRPRRVTLPLVDPLRFMEAPPLPAAAPELDHPEQEDEESEGGRGYHSIATPEGAPGGGIARDIDWLRIRIVEQRKNIEDLNQSLPPITREEGQSSPDDARTALGRDAERTIRNSDGVQIWR